MGNLEKFKAISTIFVPAAITLAGYWYSSAISEREVQAKFVELGVSILRAEPSEKTINLRNWATEILVKYSGVPIDKATRADLIESVSIPPANLPAHKLLLKDGEVMVGEEWSEVASRTYMKFESYKIEKGQVEVIYDISYADTSIDSITFTGVQELVFKGGGTTYALTLGPYNKETSALPIAVHKIFN